MYVCKRRCNIFETTGRQCAQMNSMIIGNHCVPEFVFIVENQLYLLPVFNDTGQIMGFDIPRPNYEF